jgi:hypothetical protein
MSSSQKTQYIDVLSVRKIFAKGDNNTIIPANSFLGADGLGGTQWVDISTIKNGITFNTFVTSQSTFSSGPASSRFSILDGDNVGLLPSGSGNTVKLYSKAFGEIDVVGQSSIYAFNSQLGTIDSNVTLAGTGIINISTDTSKNLINFYSPNDATSSMSTVVGNFVGLNGYLSNSISSFNSPFSTFIYSAISSFSTSQGVSLSEKFRTQTLEVSSVNISGTLQPFIQYGSNTLLAQSNTINLPRAYRNSNYIIQLTYVKTSGSPSIPLSFNTITTSNFVAVGDSGSTFHWTTYGTIV